MNMTERDWDILLAEQREAFEALVTPAEFNRQFSQEFKQAKGHSPNQLFDYIRIEKATPKAKFFVTHETLSEIHGFWCPKAAIVKDTGNKVEVQHWCKIKTIQFV